MTWKHPDAPDPLTCPACDDELAIALYPEDFANAHTEEPPDPERAHCEPAGEDDEGRPLCWCGHVVIQEPAE